MAHKPNLANVGIFYSGGGSNSDVTDSIGGAISSVRVLSQTATALTTITGVTIDDALGNEQGDGTLAYTASTNSLRWSPFNGNYGDAVVLSEDGTWFVQGYGNAGGLAITVVVANLPSTDTSNVVTVTDLKEKFFISQTEAECDAGVTKYHCFYYKNMHATLAIPVNMMWIAANTPGSDTDTIYLDPLGATDGATGPTAVANENTAPAGSTFVSPTSLTHTDVLDLGPIDPGDCVPFWVKQLTPITTVGYEDNTFSLEIYIKS